MEYRYDSPVAIALYPESEMSLELSRYAIELLVEDARPDGPLSQAATLASGLRNRIEAWVSERGEALKGITATVPHLSAHRVDTWEPLVAIAEIAGGQEWLARTFEAALALEESRK